MTIGDRIKIIRENAGLSQDAFAKTIGSKRSNIAQIEHNNQLPTIKLLVEIVRNYNVSYDYLIDGKTESKEHLQEKEVNKIVLDENQGIVKPKSIVYNFQSDYFNVNKQVIPLYEIEASAGLNLLFGDQSNQVPIDYISVPNAPKCDGAMYVRGDSMYPIMKSGDIICYKHISDLQNNLRFGEVYLLYINDGDDEYLTVKYVQVSEKGCDYVKLVSQNKYHAPKDEHISHILGAAIVKLSIRYNTIS